MTVQIFHRHYSAMLLNCLDDGPTGKAIVEPILRAPLAEAPQHLGHVDIAEKLARPRGRVPFPSTLNSTSPSSRSSTVCHLVMASIC